MSWENDEDEEFEHHTVEGTGGEVGVMSFDRVRPPERDLPFPDDLIAILFDNDNGFVCVGCLTKDDDTEDEHVCTPIFDYDTWFTGDTCKRCKKLIPPGKR